MKEQTSIRLLSLLLCCAMVLGCFPAAFAANEDGLCQHHPAHTEECGDGEEAYCTYSCEDCTAAAVSSFDSLHEIANASESMTADEIRQAVQSLDQDQLLSTLRSAGRYEEANSDYRKLSSAAGSNQAVISPNISILYGTNEYTGFTAYGTSLNNPVSEEDVFTLTIDQPNESIDIPEGYIREDAIQFSISLSNVQNAENLNAPVWIENLALPDPILDYSSSINPYFAGLFWKNSQTGQIEEIPFSLDRTDLGWLLLSFCITGAGDYVIAPKKDAMVGGSCGEHLTWTYDASKTLSISGSGEMYDYERRENYAPWAYYGYDVEQIVIGEEVTSIGAYGFYGCCFVRNIFIPAGVKEIGVQAFNPHYINTITFEGDAPHVAEDTFTDMRAVVRYPSGNATWDSVISQAGWGGASSITWIAADACASGSCGENLTWTVDKPSGTLTIRGSGEMPDYDPSSWANNPAPWDSYSSIITKVVLEYGVTSIGHYAFYSCSNLSELVISDTVTKIASESIDASSLRTVTIPASVVSLDIRSGIAGVRQIQVDANNPVYSSEDGVLFNKDKTVLLCFSQTRKGVYQIPEGVTTLGSCSFMNCMLLTKLTLPGTLTTIEEMAFDYCSSLAEVTIPVSAPITSIGRNAFKYCSSLSSIRLPESIASIEGGAFQGCSSLTSITIPEGVTDIGDWAFYWCNSLETVYYSGTQEQWDAITIGSYNDCLTNATIVYVNPGAQMKLSLPKGTVTVEASAFADCVTLESVLIPGSVTGISALAFDGCTRLNAIVFGGSAPAIAADAFAGVTATVYYPENDGTWTSDTMQNYGGTLTWVPYAVK